MVRQSVPGLYELDYQTADGVTHVYRFACGQEALAATTIALHHCQRKLPRRAALALLEGVRVIVKRQRPKPVSRLEWCRRVVCAFVSREWTLLVAAWMYASVNAERKLTRKMSRERKCWAECTGAGTKGSGK